MNDTEVSLKFNNIIKNESKLERYSNTIEKIRITLNGINTGAINQLSNASGTLKDIKDDTNEISENFKSTLKTGIMTGFIATVKNLANRIGFLTAKSSSYLENMNLLDVAFNNNTEEADKFVNKLSQMYGLDESWGYRTVGIFKQLANAMGLANEVGNKLSTTMTQFAIDISSLYNIDTSNAVSILQSALAGQTKPARRLGADITQTTLQTTLDAEGIDRYVASLSYAEKRLVIVASLLKQVSEANGDWGRTIESVANQTRILSEQWERFTRALGNVFLPIIKVILPYLNAILMVMTDIISLVATLIGYNPEDFDFFSEVDESVIDLNSGLVSATSNAKKLKQGLRGFDRLNVITSPSKVSGGGGAGGLGVDPKILELFNKYADDYNNKLKDVKMRATEIKEAIEDWLGITDKSYTRLKLIAGVLGTIAGLKIIKGIGGVITGTSRLGKLLGTGGLYKTLKKIIDASKILGAKDGLKYVFLDSKLGKGITTLTGGFGKLAGALGLTVPQLGLIVGGVTALAGGFIYAYKNNDKFREKVDKLVKSIKDSLVPLLETTKEFLEDIWKNVLKPLWENVLKPVGKFLIDVIVFALGNIIDYLQFLYDHTLKPLYPILKWMAETGLNLISEALKKIVGFLEDDIKLLQKIWEDYIKPIHKWVKEKIEQDILPKLQQITDKLKPISDWLEKIKGKTKIEIDANTKPAGSKLKDFFEGMGEGLFKAMFPQLSWATSLAKLKKIAKLENGGMPKVGQMFVANENGAELVGHIGGQTFVANQNQMMDLLDKKIGNAQNNKQTQIYNIYLDENHKLCTYTLEQLQGIAKTNGRAITIGG